MGCNCRGKNASSSYVYVAPNGTVKKYATEVEAKAAFIRAGRVGEVKAA
jgi:hypothetical protein